MGAPLANLDAAFAEMFEIQREALTRPRLDPYDRAYSGTRERHAQHQHAQPVPDGVVVSAGPDGPDASRVCLEHRWMSASVPYELALTPPQCPRCQARQWATAGRLRFERVYGKAV